MFEPSTVGVGVVVFRSGSLGCLDGWFGCCKSPSKIEWGPNPNGPLGKLLVLFVYSGFFEVRKQWVRSLEISWEKGAAGYFTHWFFADKVRPIWKKSTLWEGPMNFTMLGSGRKVG